MIFDRIQKLGTVKFQKVVNELMRGTPAVMVARLIQQEWGDFQNVSEDTLVRQLRRLYTAITNGAFGGDLAQQAREKASVRIKLFQGSTLNTLDELNQIELIQRARVMRLWEKEQKADTRLVALNTAIRDYRDLLLAIQKIRFDLGLDEYKRRIPTVRASEASVT